MSNILLSPLGRSPGAVSGLYHALDESGVGIDRLIVLATADTAVQESARALRYHFQAKPKEFLIIQPVSSKDDPDMVDERAVYGFIHRVNAVLYNKQPDDRVYIGIAGGRKTMSALATLSAYIYGAAAAYHFWVHEEIERCGDIFDLPSQPRKREWIMHPSKFHPSEFNQSGEHSHQLVSIPLAPFDRLWDQERFSEILAENPYARQALLRAASERERQEIEALRSQHLTLEETIHRARQVFEMTDSEWLVDAVIKLSVTEGNVNYEVELKPYISDPSLRTQIVRKLKSIETLAGASEKFLAYLLGVLTPILVTTGTHLLGAN